jgi:hypothetical protein
MSPIQQILLGVGAVATKTYVDDVFSTYVYAGNSTARSINNGIDLSGEGGMLWVKRRNQSEEHIITDTVRGAANYIASSNADGSNSGSGISSFNSTGFSLGTVNHVNGSGHTYASWTFRKSPMFDVVTWTGNGNGSRQISHSLESVPGCIMIKRTDGSYGWYVYHRGLDSSNPERYYLRLNETDASQNTTGQQWMAAAPTSTNFTLAADIGGSGYEGLNTNGQTYVAYVFAGGESTAATARSVDFDGSDDYLTIADHADFDVGTNWTGEAWFKADSLSGNWDAIFGQWSGGYVLEYVGTDLRFYNVNTSYKSLGAVPLGQWHHVAISKEGSTTRIFLNGVQVVPDFDMGTTSSTNDFYIGGNVAGAGWFNGKISNVRIVQGTAVYTSAFKPPTEPLTNITNTKLLCCNNSSTTGSTVTPGTITAGSSPTARTDSPFDDPAGFVFGDAGDQNVIKCGSYVGNGSSTGPEINLGWEPQWLLIKQSDGTGDWTIFDSMRGIVTGGTENYLHPNSSDQETTGLERVDLTSTGFKLTDSGWINYDTKKYIFCALRRPDGYVGKPPELGTDVFAASYNTSNAPWFKNNNFPVDLSIHKRYDQSEDWYQASRLQGIDGLRPSTTAAEAYITNYWQWDYMEGWNSYTDGTSAGNYISYQFKRHAGFDVVTWTGDDVRGRQIPHSLNAVPEMMWIKSRSAGYDWVVYHKGLNGGTNPEQKYLQLNSSNAEATASVVRFNNQAPTANHFTVGEDGEVNAIIDGSGATYIAMLFASVDGISKVGSYTGNGTSGLGITVGFQPRFVIIKNISSNYSWLTFDTTRGWGSGNDKLLKLNSDAAEYTSTDYGAPTSNGFTVGSSASINQNNDNFIYYAHA